MTESASTADRSWMVPVFALTFATVAAVTANLIVAGVLPLIATELDVDIPTAGLLISGYALGVAIISPVLSLLTGSLPRKRLMLATLAVFIVGNVLCAMATSYGTLLAARIVVACCHGLIFGLASVLATRIAPEGRKSSAVSLVVAGSTIATIAGLPLGTAIGNAYGWRISFWMIAAVGAVALLAVALLIPAKRAQRDHTSNPLGEIRAATRPIVLCWYAVFILSSGGALAVMAYIVPLLTEVSGVPIGMVPWVLFGMGVTGFIGNLVGGRLADWKPGATLAGILFGFMLTLILVAQLATSAWGVAIALWAAWGIGFGFPAPLRARIISIARDAPTLASMLTSSAGSLGAAAGAAAGGAAISAGWGYASVPLLSAVFAAVSLLMTLALLAYDRRRKAVPA